MFLSYVSFVCLYKGCEIEGSLAFCALMLFLCSILGLMCSGNSLHVECCLLGCCDCLHGECCL